MIELNIKNAILSTLAFFDIFNHPLKAKEISQLILYSNASYNQINLYLKESRRVYKYDNYYFLGKKRNCVSTRIKNEKIAKKNWKKIKRIQWILSLIPNIKMIAICNNLAMKTNHKNSDIDLFIICKKNRMFQARFFITILLQLLGLRRHGKKISSRLCLSFFIDESAPSLKNIHLKNQDIYLAYWLKTLQVIVGKKTYNDFTKANQKINNKYFLQNGYNNFLHYKKTGKITKKIKYILEKILNGKVGDKVELKLKTWQINRAKEKMNKLSNSSGTIINEKILKFHDNDKRKEYQRKWEIILLKHLEASEQKRIKKLLKI